VDAEAGLHLVQPGQVLEVAVHHVGHEGQGIVDLGERVAVEISVLGTETPGQGTRRDDRAHLPDVVRADLPHDGVRVQLPHVALQERGLAPHVPPGYGHRDELHRPALTTRRRWLSRRSSSPMSHPKNQESPSSTTLLRPAALGPISPPRRPHELIA
jgi:hypothetical protein